MPLQKPTSHRRAASSFVRDDNEKNLIQLSPHRNVEYMEQRSPFTMTRNQESKTNFIGDCILNSEIPRACVVTKTGEKHLINLDNTPPLNKSTANPFALQSPRYSAPTMSRISEKSSSQLSLSSDKISNSSGKLNKKPKLPKRPVNHKHRLSFTPRNMETNSATQLSAFSERPYEIKRNISTETQTENFHTYNSYIKKSPKPNTSLNWNYVTPTTSHLKFNTNLNRDLNIQERYYPTNLESMEPLRIYTKTNPNLKKYSELRSFASAITLITVISWLFATFFDVKCLWDYLHRLWQYVQNSFRTKEKPKTKMELLVSFLQDLWS